MRTVLHIGCGTEPLPLAFKGWKEIRYDIDPSVNPHIVGDMLDMKDVKDESVDAVFTSHTLEHVFTHQVPVALSEMRRVLKKGGAAYIIVPDLEDVLGKPLDEEVYVSPAGPITAADMIWGHTGYISQGKIFYAHKTGFTKNRLEKFAAASGFTGEVTREEGYNLLARLTRNNHDTN